VPAAGWTAATVLAATAGWMSWVFLTAGR